MVSKLSSFLKFLIVCAVLLSLYGCSSPSISLEEKRVERMHEYVPGTKFDVKTVNGSITIRKSQVDEIRIKAHLRLQSIERLNATKVSSVFSEDGTLVVRVEWPEGKRLSNEGVSFEIETPDSADTRLHSKNGKISVFGLSGKSHLETSNGGIEVKNLGEVVFAKTSNGKVKVIGCVSSIDIETSNGGVEVIDAGHDVSAKTSNGSIRISLNPSAPGPIKAKTSNGSIDLLLGESFSGQLSAETSNSKIVIDDSFSENILQKGKKEAKLKFDDSAILSSAKSSNGSIKIRRSIKH